MIEETKSNRNKLMRLPETDDEREREREREREMERERECVCVCVSACMCVCTCVWVCVCVKCVGGVRAHVWRFLNGRTSVWICVVRAELINVQERMCVCARARVCVSEKDER